MSAERTWEATLITVTGGIGSGKSTVGEQFTGYGMVVIDADEVIRDLSEPGQPGFDAKVDVLGEEIIDEEGKLDSDKIASIIFDNLDLRKALQRELYPLAWSDMLSRVVALDRDDIAVLEIPLPNKEDMKIMDGVVAVNTSVENAVNRAVANRPYTREQILARVRAQITNEERAEMAGFIIENDGTWEEFLLAIEGAREWIQARHQAKQRK